jgi:E3 ubiquitin-protein ligase synoviolin
MMNYGHISLARFGLCPLPIFIRHVAFVFHERILSFSHSHNVPSLHDHQRLITGQVLVLFGELCLMFHFLQMFIEGDSFWLLLTLHFSFSVVDTASDIVTHIILVSDRRSGGNSQSAFRANLVAQLVFQVLHLVLGALFTIAELKQAFFPLWALRSIWDSVRAIMDKFLTFWKWHSLRRLISDRLPAPDDTELGPESLCVICRAALSQEDSRKLPCGHLYHIDCLDRWLSKNKACPFCQKDISRLLTEAVSTQQQQQPVVTVDAPEEVESPEQDSEIVEKLREIIWRLAEIEEDVEVIRREAEAKRGTTAQQES